MLQIVIPAVEGWDEVKEEFVEIKKEQVLHLEHSLISISNWEAKYCKPFLSKEPKTHEETVDYIKCMTLNKNVNPEVYTRLTSKNIQEVNKYIEAPMTATTFSKDVTGKKGGRSQRVTSELIYAWMIELEIPIELEKWHLNRLITEIQILNIRRGPSKKMSKKDIMRRNSELNEARRKRLGSNG